MALRIRKDGRILCAAIHSEEVGDTYINDGLHYEMSVINKVIGTEENEKHKIHGQWWWINNVPEGIIIDSFYTEKDQYKDQETASLQLKIKQLQEEVQLLKIELSGITGQDSV